MQIEFMKRSKEEQPVFIYREFVHMNLFVTITIILLLQLLLAAAVTAPIIEPESTTIAVIICSILFVFFLFIGINFRGIYLSVTKDYIEIKFGLFTKKQIPFVDIQKCEVIKASFRTYWGMGVRVGVDGSLAYTTNFKEAIRLTYNKNKLFVFSTKKHQELYELIMKSITAK